MMGVIKLFPGRKNSYTNMHHVYNFLLVPVHSSKPTPSLLASSPTSSSSQLPWRRDTALQQPRVVVLPFEQSPFPDCAGLEGIPGFPWNSHDLISSKNFTRNKPRNLNFGGFLGTQFKITRMKLGSIKTWPSHVLCLSLWWWISLGLLWNHVNAANRWSKISNFAMSLFDIFRSPFKDLAPCNFLWKDERWTNKNISMLQMPMHQHPSGIRVLVRPQACWQRSGVWSPNGYHRQLPHSWST